MTTEPSDPIRPTGDQMLARLNAEQKPERGRLRIYMGMAQASARHTRCSKKAHRRHDRGTDVVVGFVETYGRATLPRCSMGSRRSRGAISSTRRSRGGDGRRRRSSPAIRPWARWSTNSPTPTSPSRPGRSAGGGRVDPRCRHTKCQHLATSSTLTSIADAVETILDVPVASA